MAKGFGCVVEYTMQRSDALMEEYHKYSVSANYLKADDIFSFIVNQPCQRFWVSPGRAVSVVRRMIKGDELLYMRPSKREMFFEIFNRVSILRNSDKSSPLDKLVMDVVDSPAPKFYLSPGSAKIMVSKAKKQWYQKKIQHQKRYSS